MITLSWIIERLLVKPTEGSLTDVVITADWRCNGTQDQVLGWCYANGVDQTAIEANVTAQIENQINPPVIAPPLPWAPPVMIVPPMLPQVTPEIVADAPVVADAPAA